MNARVPTLDPLLRPRVLAGLLRNSRLTLLYGEADQGRTALLRSGMLPLLRRRASDLAASLGMSTQGFSRAHSPDRRAGGPSAAGSAELTILVDDWSEVPLAQVLQRLQLALPAPVAASIAEAPRLAGALAKAARQLQVRFLFVFDRFEDHLSSAHEREGSDSFAEEIIGVVNDPALPAHFLLAVRDDDEPLLGQFQSRIRGFGDHSLRLPRHRQATPPESAARTADIYRSIETTLARIAESARQAPWQPTPAGTHVQAEEWLQPGGNAPAPLQTPLSTQGPLPRRGPRGGARAHAAAAAPGLRAVPAPEDAPASAAVSADPSAGGVPAAATLAAIAVMAAEAAGVEAQAPAAALPAARHRRRPPTRRWSAVLAAATALLVASYPLWRAPPRPATQSMARLPAPPQSPVANLGAGSMPPAPLPAAPPGVAPARIAPPATPALPDFYSELAALLGPAGRGDARPDPNGEGSAPLAFRSGAPRLAVVHYDALQVVRADPATPPLRIVAPLVLDEVLFVVRADAPLNFVHEIAGRQLQAGAADGARALTATSVYRRLFGAAPPAPATAPLGAAAALQRLADSGAGSGAGSDDSVVVVVGARALDAWASAHPDAMRRLKLLGLDRQHKASRRALQTYLPVTLRAAEHRSWLAQDTATLAVMSFVVTPASTNAADAAAVDTFARTLCGRLPALQRGGDPKWREVVPGLEVPAGWPYSTTAALAFAACAAPAPAPAAAASRSTQPPGARS